VRDPSRSSVGAALQSFLAADELDELAALRGAITTVDGAEAAEVSRVVQAWSDRQAVANLLLHPRLIPSSDRLPAVLRGLAAKSDDYLALAAVVGLQRVEDDEIPIALRPTIAEQLVRLIEQGLSPTARRASLTIGDFAQDLGPALLVTMLGHADPEIRHNVLSALLAAFGVERVFATADAEVAAGRLSPDVATALRDSLVAAGLDPAASVDDEAVLDSPLGAPLLGYIPNYRDWPRWSAAPPAGDPSDQ
jgi:hypothetical protein